MTLRLSLLPGRYAVCRLAPGSPLPLAPTHPVLWSLTVTRDEISVIAPEDLLPPGARVERGFRALAVQGPLDFALTGVLAALTGPLAAAGVPIFSLSTFDTDIVLVREPDLDRALAALRRHGHEVVELPPAASLCDPDPDA